MSHSQIFNGNDIPAFLPPPSTSAYSLQCLISWASGKVSTHFISLFSRSQTVLINTLINHFCCYFQANARNSHLLSNIFSVGVSTSLRLSCLKTQSNFSNFILSHVYALKWPSLHGWVPWLCFCFSSKV